MAGDGKFFLGASSGFPPDAVGATRPRPRAICKISKTALNLEQSLAANRRGPEHLSQKVNVEGARAL